MHNEKAAEQEKLARMQKAQAHEYEIETVKKAAEPKTDTVSKKPIETSDNLRPSSISEMMDLFKDILAEEPKPFEDSVDMAVELERRFVDLVQNIGLQKYVHIADTPDYPALIITDYPVEPPTGTGSQTQFGFHNFYQKTYIWDKQNPSSSSWAVSVHLDDYRFYAWNEGKKKFELKFAPIFYVAFSDGNLDYLLTNLYPTNNRNIEAARLMAQQSKDAYTATLAEELIIRDKMSTGIIDSKDKEIDQLKRQNTKGAKKIAAQAIRWMELAGESMSDSNLDRLRAIFSKGAVRTFGYIIGGILVFMGFLLVLQLLTGMQFYTLPNGGSPGGDPTDPEPYIPGLIISTLLGMIL